MALTDRSIDMTERGVPHVASASDLEAWGLTEPLIELAAQGIIGLRASQSFRIMEPRNFVGALRMPGRSVRIHPKEPQLFADLHRLIAALATKRLTAEELQTPDEAIHALDPSVAFLQALKELMGEGFPFFYGQEVVTTSSPRGGISFGETVRSLHSRGIRHQVRCRIPHRHYHRGLTAATSTASAVVSGARLLPPHRQRELDLVSSVIGADSSAVSPEEALALAGQALEEFQARPEVLRLLDSAIAVLRNESVLWHTLRPAGGGESRFCDTERLWEVALLTALREQLDGTGLRAEFHALASSGTTLFPGGGPQLDPDIVIYDGARASAVIDAKYKVASSANAGDVYQIFGYTERLVAKVGVLCYVSPGESWTRELGASPSGATFWAFGISASDVLGALFTVAREARRLLEVTVA